jgi:phage regulator Rha-like protein
MQDSNLITLVQSEFRVDSRLLATQLDHRHRTILENIDKHILELQELNPLPFETEKGIALATGGFAKATRYALLSEDQCYFVLTLMRNNDKVVRLKLNLVKAFSNARKQIAERDMVRLEGKKVRRSETDAIKDLITYAKGQGSTTDDRWFYVNLTVMTNNIMGVKAGQRDFMDSRQLQLLKLAETMIEIAIRDGMKAELSHKEIYQLCKDRVSDIIIPLRQNNLLT